MARCYTCGRTHQTGHSRSHSNIASKRKFKLNLHPKTLDGKKRQVCSRCIKTQNKAD